MRKQQMDNNKRYNNMLYIPPGKPLHYQSCTMVPYEEGWCRVELGMMDCHAFIAFVPCPATQPWKPQFFLQQLTVLQGLGTLSLPTYPALLASVVWMDDLNPARKHVNVPSLHCHAYAVVRQQLPIHIPAGVRPGANWLHCGG
jgi:hypothetical protein